MNPEDFSRSAFGGEIAEAIAMHVLGGEKAGSREVFELLISLFTHELERFRIARDANMPKFGWRGRDTARLPRAHALILIPGYDSLLVAVGTGSEPLERLPNGAPCRGAALHAARVIVAGCGPRFRRCLQIIRSATTYCVRHDALDALSR